MKVIFGCLLFSFGLVQVVRGRHELAVLEKLVVSKQTELQHSKRWLAEERVAWLNRFWHRKVGSLCLTKALVTTRKGGNSYAVMLYKDKTLETEQSLCKGRCFLERSTETCLSQGTQDK